MADIQQVLGDFLRDRFSIQFNRGMTGMFQWSVIVGQRGFIEKGATAEHGRGVGDLGEAIFNACIAAKGLDKREASLEQLLPRDVAQAGETLAKPDQS